MNVMRNLLVRRVKEMVGDTVKVDTTYGYITKYHRQKLGLPKTHDTDAFVIAGNYGAERCGYVYHCKQIRCHNRQLHKMKPSKGGVRKSVNGPRFMHGIRMNDIVRCDGKLYMVTGRRTRDSFHLKPLDGGKELDRATSRFKFVRSVGSLFVYAP
jgi:N6-L-threonylcarbamoyladenine synthase